MRHGSHRSGKPEKVRKSTFSDLSEFRGFADRVRTGPGNPGKSLNFKKLFSRPGKSWNSDAGHGKSWKSELGSIFLFYEVFTIIEMNILKFLTR